jgi:hypothetical protein
MNDSMLSLFIDDIPHNHYDHLSISQRNIVAIAGSISPSENRLEVSDLAIVLERCHLETELIKEHQHVSSWSNRHTRGRITHLIWKHNGRI